MVKVIRIFASHSKIPKKSKIAENTRKCIKRIPKKPNILKKWLQWGLFLTCLGAFMVNSHQNFLKFIEPTTMVSESLWWSHDNKLPLPSLTLCRPKPPLAPGSISDDHLRIEDMLHCSKQQNSQGCLQKVKESSSYGTNVYMNFSVHKVTHTRFRGKCFTVSIPFRVSPLSFLELELRTEPLLMYLHEPEEEFFIHWSWFPNKMAPYLHLRDEDNTVFASITKSEREDQEGCMHWTLESQIECLKENVLKDYLQSGPNCTTPWLNSILMPKPLQRPFCTTHEELKRDHDSIDGSMAKHMAFTCPAPCLQVVYDLSAEYFGDQVLQLPETGAVKIVTLDYSTTAVKKLRSVPLSSFNDFVSSIGGSLGLFLDFSVISILYALANKMTEILEMRRCKDKMGPA